MLNKAKPAERQAKILFVYSAEGFEKGKNKNILRPQDIERIAKAFYVYQDEERYCRVVSLDEVRENDYNLNITRYVDVFEPEEEIDVAQAAAELRRAEARACHTPNRQRLPHLARLSDESGLCPQDNR